MYNALLSDKHGRGLRNLILADRPSRVDRDAVTHFGNVIDEINANIEKRINGLRIALCRLRRAEDERALLRRPGHCRVEDCSHRIADVKCSVADGESAVAIIID